jgi:large subunit ribosomal protein L10
MRREKHLLLDEVKDQIDAQGSFVVVTYSKFSANSAHAFRRQIARLGGDYEVMRKRILRKAAHAAGIELENFELPGHIGLVFLGKDPLETTKAVYRLSAENDKAFRVIGGRIDGQLYDAKQVEVLSNLPSKDEMRAQFLATLEAPMSQTLAVMEALLTSVVYCLDNKSKQE